MINEKRQHERLKLAKARTSFVQITGNLASLVPILGTVLLMIISCNQEPDNAYTPSQSAMEKLQKDVMEQSNHTDVNTLVNLCFTDFAFDPKNRATVLKVYNTINPLKTREVLLADANFLKICQVRGLDTADIPIQVKMNKKIFEKH